MATPRSAGKEGRKPLPNNRMTLLLQLSISWLKVTDRVFHTAFLENKVVYSVCKDKLNKFKTFARNGGLKQHFRTIRGQRFTEQTIANWKTLSRRCKICPLSLFCLVLLLSSIRSENVNLRMLFGRGDRRSSRCKLVTHSTRNNASTKESFLNQISKICQSNL